MPIAAAIPAIIGGVASGAGAAISAGAMGASPSNLYPQTTTNYLQQLNSVGNDATGMLKQNIVSGNPTNVGPAWDALMAANKQQTAQGGNTLLGSFAQSGLRYSSNAMQGLSSYESQTNQNFLQILANYTMQAQEAAANRQLGASEYALSAEAGPALTTFGPGPSPAGSALSSAGNTMNMIQLISLMKSAGLIGPSGANAGSMYS